MALNNKSDDVNLGILIALGVIYSNGAETVAEELVRACDEKALLRVAKREQDPWLKDLKKTVQFLYGGKLNRATPKRAAPATRCDEQKR